MKNAEIGNRLGLMADLMEIGGQDTFRVNSYRKAATALLELTEPIENVAAAGRLMEIPGIGKNMAAKVEQYLATGTIEAYEQLIKDVPLSLAELLHIQGMGPKTIARLWKEAGIACMEDLRKVLQESPQTLVAMKGLGEKKVQQLQAALAFVESTGGRITLGKAAALADEMLDYMGKAAGVKKLVAAGSLRRGKETIGDLDFLASSEPANSARIIAAFTQAPSVARVQAQGPTKSSVVLGDVQADLRVVEPGSFGSALAYFTGSKAHNVRLRERAVKRGWKLNEYGLFDGDKQIAGADEEGLYAAMGLAFIPPELREDRGEIEAAQANRLPKLLELADIRGDFHMHTTPEGGGTGSDGVNTIDEMIDACRRRGYKFLCISDHSKTQRIAHGLDEAALRRHFQAIRAAARRHPDLWVMCGCEVDILRDGSLDFDDSVLAEMDFVIVSPHVSLKMDGAEATKRLIQAIEHPHVHCLGHPTGRLINERPGMDIDLDAVAEAAAAHGVALEVNAHYMRLDLKDTHVRTAIEKGAKICINSDAHATGELDVMRYGVLTARRGWATKKDIVNAWSVDELRGWLAKKSAPAMRK